MAHLGETDLTRNFNPMVLIRGREYERSKKVLKAHIETGGWVYGSVKGSDASPYSQIIQLKHEHGGYTIIAECTCPTSKNCKHSAAVLFHLIAGNAFEGMCNGSQGALAPTHPMLEKWLASVQDAAEDHDKLPEGARQELLFLLRVERISGRATPLLQPVTAHISREGVWREPQPFRMASLRAQNAPRYLRHSDVELLKRLEAHLACLGENTSFDLYSIDAPPLLEQVVETGRCFWGTAQSKALRKIGFTPVKPIWVEDELGFQRFRLRGVKGKILPLCPPWYADPVLGVCGPLDTGISPKIAQSLCAAPVVAPEHAGRVRQVLGGTFGKQSPLLPREMPKPIEKSVAPVPVLVLGWACVRHTHSSSTAQKGVALPAAKLRFKYEGHVAPADQAELRVRRDQDLLIYERQIEKEEEAWSRLRSAGWFRIDEQTRWETSADDEFQLLLDPEGDREQKFLKFISDSVEDMALQGWEVLWEDGKVLHSSKGSLLGKISETDGDRLRLELSLDLESESVDLLTIVRQLDKSGYFASDERHEGSYYLKTPSGSVVDIPGYKLEELWVRIQEIFGKLPSRELALSRVRSFELEDFTSALDGFDLPQKISAALEELKGAKGRVPLRSDLEELLRPYQRDGVNWLQFLFRFGMGGILADDMGLGKTVQTLALIQSQLDAGECREPVLIVAPTSTLPNWQAEIKRFTPGIKVLTLHGSHRKELFDSIDQHQVVLTSYPLLVRDKQALLTHSYSLVVLDEAQNIKNSGTHAARAAYELQANCRIALSGTPIENHLEELWSIFKFALPGLLGGQTEFRRDFRTPIEQGGSKLQRELLERRIRPFFLRRTKEQVAPELPAKTEIIDFVSLESSQRELYETVAALSQEKIRKAIREKGWDETRFEALQALLRLRQICCDPHLIKQEVQSSKLDRLISMLKELKDEGRRTLMFSQFTSMLDIIEQRLEAENIAWVRLCGSTKDRATPVEKFQAGEVGVFLISLKAGGVGINLTAADTVIHYDPWWNPAVERQATDRAHRIGQDKPVFVYKLVASDTIEERILELQQKKAELSRQLFSEEGKLAGSVTPEDFEWMLRQDKPKSEV